MRSKGMDPANFESYLMIHKHGMPPHGGLGIGLERLLMVMEAVGAPFPPAPTADLYLANLGPQADRVVQKLTYELRQLGVCAERDLMGRGLKPQMKYADKLGAKFSLVIGDGEIESGTARLKDMSTGEQTAVELSAQAIAAVVKQGEEERV